MGDIKKLGVILRPNTPNLKDSYFLFTKIAQSFGFEVILEANSAKMIGVDFGVDFSLMCEISDVLVSIGGDGTLISLMRHSIDYNKPIFGINMGRLGFLTSIKIDELEGFLCQLKNKQYSFCLHLLLSGEIFDSKSTHKKLDSRNQKFFDSKNTQKMCCVNEFLISKQNVSGMVSIRAEIDGRYFNTYRSDGLIIGTPTGSSAYNISAGGSIVYPYNRNVLLTPVCAHSLTQKPLILNDKFTLEFSVVEGEAKIIIDGQDIINFDSGKKFRVTVLEKSAMLIYDKNRDYFAILREKFGWGD